MTVLITGSTKGIGLQIAETFYKEGYTVILNGRTKKEESKYYTSFFDVTNVTQIYKEIEKILDKVGNIDVLINNAGIYNNSSVKNMPMSFWESVINTNLTGTFNCSKILLEKSKLKRIINISSILGQTGARFCSNYSASKAGIVGFTKSLAREVGPLGITVNVISPGYIDSGMTNTLSKNFITKIIDEIPLGRLGSAVEVANLALFLASDKANYITGQTINVDGGLLMK